MNEEEEQAATRALAEVLWTEAQQATARAPADLKHDDEEDEKVPSAPAPGLRHLSLRSRQLRRRRQQQQQQEGQEEHQPRSLVIGLLERLRARWSTVCSSSSSARPETNTRGGWRTAAAERRVVARALLGLLLLHGSFEVDDTAEEVVGHALPLCFALMEPFNSDEEGEGLQHLGFLAWARMAAVESLGPHMVWHTGIQAAVFSRCFNVCVRAAAALLIRAAA